MLFPVGQERRGLVRRRPPWNTELCCVNVMQLLAFHPCHAEDFICGENKMLVCAFHCPTIADLALAAHRR